MEIFDEPITLMFLHISVELQVLKMFSLFQRFKINHLLKYFDFENLRLKKISKW